jgi:hypothetical protein
MTLCYLLPVLPDTPTAMETGGCLYPGTIRLHRLHRLQNRPHGPRPPLPARLFDATVPPVSVTPSNAVQHREGLRHAV